MKGTEAKIWHIRLGCGVPKVIRSDNGTEYTNRAFKQLCIDNKIRQEFTVPDTPQQNGIAERYNRTIVEMARCLLIDSKLLIIEVNVTNMCSISLPSLVFFTNLLLKRNGAYDV